MRCTVLILIFLLVPLGVQSCVTTTPEGAIREMSLSRLSKPAAEFSPAPPKGTSVEGRPIPARIFGEGPDNQLFLGGIHGDEPAGVVLMERLCGYLKDRPSLVKGKRIVVVPATNPDGLWSKVRSNARGVDLNRNFDSQNRINEPRYGMAPLSEPEARFIASLIEDYPPSRIITLHEPIACVDWDGPARDLASTMAEASGLPMKKLGTRPGSLGAFAGVDLKIPIVTVELPRAASAMSPDQVWDRYGHMLVKAIRHPN
jgi:protein MpaA